MTENSRVEMDIKTTLESFGYTAVGNIGEGQFGKVKLATSEKHPDKVAIKILNCPSKLRPTSNKFLTRELSILRTVRHPHIVRVHEIHEVLGGKIFIVMEAAEMDLYEKIRRGGRIPIAQAREWFSQLVSAMVYLHENNIVHRDIKCKNVLLTADNKAKLADFGFSRLSKGFPELNQTMCGTKVFMPPEVLMSLPYDSKKFDVWSLGVLLYKMVIGRLPFTPANLRELRQLQSKPVVYPWRIRVGPFFRDLISNMLQVNPHERFSMTEVAEHPWLLSCQKRLKQSCKGLGLRLQFLSRVFRATHVSPAMPVSTSTAAAAPEAAIPAAPAVPTPVAATAVASTPEGATPVAPAVPTPAAATTVASTPEEATPVAPAVPTPVAATAVASTPEGATPVAPAVPTPAAAITVASTPEEATPVAPAVPTPAAATTVASTPEGATPVAPAVPTPAAATAAVPAAPPPEDPTPTAPTFAAPAAPAPKAPAAPTPAAPAAAREEVVGEEFGCFAALQKRLRKIFRLKSTTSSPPAPSTKAEQRRVNKTPQPKVRQGLDKILKKMRKGAASGAQALPRAPH